MNLTSLVGIAVGVTMMALGAFGIAGYLPGYHVTCQPPVCPPPGGGGGLYIEAVFSLYAQNHVTYLTDSSGVYAINSGFEKCKDVAKVELTITPAQAGRNSWGPGVIPCGSTQDLSNLIGAFTQGNGNATVEEQVFATFSCGPNYGCASTQSQTYNFYYLAYPNYYLRAAMAVQINGLFVTVQDQSTALNETIFNDTINWGNGNISWSPNGTAGGSYTQVYELPGAYEIQDQVQAQEKVYPDRVVIAYANSTSVLNSGNTTGCNANPKACVPPPPNYGGATGSYNLITAGLLFGGVSVVLVAVPQIPLGPRIGGAIAVAAAGLGTGYWIGGV